MNVFDSFQKIFNKCPIAVLDDQWSVQETDSCALFRTLTIQNTGKAFFVFEKGSYANMSCISSKRSSFLEDKDCDGVALTEIGGKKILILSELKSSLDSLDVLKAYKQIVFTYLKLYMMLSLCQDFDIDNWSVVGIIACHPPKGEDQKTKLQLEYLNIEESASRPDVKCLVRLLFENKIETSLSNIPFTQNLPLNDQLQRGKFNICLKTADTISSSELSLELSKII